MDGLAGARCDFFDVFTTGILSKGRESRNGRGMETPAPATTLVSFARSL